jgi:metacaspase-1
MRTAISMFLCLGLHLACAPAPPEEPDSPSPAQAATRPPQLRALLIGVSQYAKGTGWQALHADRDVELLREALRGRGFTEILTLENEAATRSGIETAYREHLLAPAQAGDTVVLHFSGHGRQLTDDDDDEIDGLDEALAPHDASSFDGEKVHERYLRDDALALWVSELAARVGPAGSVLLLLDSCFSGTPRGDDRPGLEPLPVRGAPPLGPPRPGATGPDRPGFLDDRARGESRFQDAPERSWAPILAMTAARHNELARETLAEGGPAGAFSLALALELGQIARDATYRELHERVRWRMASWVHQQPQAEGAVDRTLLGGQARDQEPYFAVEPSTAGPGFLIVRGGLLAGLLPGTEVALHSASTVRRHDREPPLATGRVTEVGTLTATVTLDGPPPPTLDQPLRAFVTRPSFGLLRLRLALVDLEPGLEANVRKALSERLPAVEIGPSAPQWVLRATHAQSVQLETASGHVVLGPISSKSPELPGQLERRLVDGLRNQYLRGLSLRDASLQIELELVRLDCPPGASSRSFCRPRPGAGEATPLRIGDTFALTAHNRGSAPAHLSILDLPADGRIVAFWPNPRTGDPTALPAGASRELDALYSADGPVGTEVVLAIASQEAVDLRPLLSSERPWAQSRGGGPFEELLELTHSGAPKGVARFPLERVSSHALVLTLEAGP